MLEDEIGSFDPKSPEGLARLYLGLWNAHPSASQLVSLQPDAAAMICSALIKALDENSKLTKGFKKREDEAELRGYNKCLGDKHYEQKLVLERKHPKGYLQVGTFRREVWTIDGIIHAAHLAGVQVEII